MTAEKKGNIRFGELTTKAREKTVITRFASSQLFTFDAINTWIINLTYQLSS